MNKALITGVTGHDGAHLAGLLLGKGYEVHGIKRRTSLFNTDRIDHLYQDPHVADRRFILHHGDLTDWSSLIRIIQQVKPDENDNLAAQSHVAVSFEEPEYTASSDAIGTLRILERRSVSWDWRRSPASTKPPPPSATDWCRKSRRRRPLPSTRAAPTQSPSSTPTGSL